MLALSRRGSRIHCFVDLNALVGPTNPASAARVLDYFWDATAHWEGSGVQHGDLDLIDRLELVHLQWIVPPQLWWNWYHAREKVSQTVETSHGSGSTFTWQEAVEE